MFVYRDLEIYKEARRLAIVVHDMSLTLPKFELYEAGSQIRRSSKSITSMIVEGYGRRRYKADFIKYLVYFIAECDETIVHLDMLHETRSLTKLELYNEMKNSYVILSKKINKYTIWVEEEYEWRPESKKR
jgi:four helix bundle protein